MDRAGTVKIQSTSWGLVTATVWGDNSGEMGALVAVDLGTSRTAVAIACGGSYMCALLDGGSVKCWGYNYYGQLGVGHTNAVGDSSGEMGDANTMLVLCLTTMLSSVGAKAV